MFGPQSRIKTVPNSLQEPSGGFSRYSTGMDTFGTRVARNGLIERFMGNRTVFRKERSENCRLQNPAVRLDLIRFFRFGDLGRDTGNPIPLEPQSDYR